MPRQRSLSPQAWRLIGALLEDPQAWQHGYDLSKRTGLKAGTLYPLLIRLSEQGMLEATWLHTGLPGRPPRHLYRLTAQGVEVGHEEGALAVRRPRGLLKPAKAVS